MPIYAKQNAVSWRFSDGEMGTDEYIYTGEVAAEMTWDVALGVMRPMTQIEVARAAIPAVSRRQMLTALHRAGLLATVKDAVAGGGDIELQIAFDEGLEFDRGNAFIATMAAVLGKTDAEVDAIFALAASI